MPDQFTNPVQGKYEQFWFLYEKETRGNQNLLTFRPFFYSFQDNTTSYRANAYLFPVYYREETNYWYTWTSLFLFTGTGFKHAEGEEESDAILAPLFFWGSGDGPKDQYFSFFPLAGSIRNKISYSRIRFFLFPLYSDWEYKTYKAHSIVWPLVMWGGSESRSEFRIFPFFSRKIHTGKYERYSLLWPFFQWGEEKLNKKEPTNYKIFFPFYLSKDSEEGNMRSRAFFWFPVINSLFSYGYDRKTGQQNYSALFIFFQYATSEKKDLEKLIFFPFYGYSYVANKEAEFISPFYIRLSQNTSHLKSESRFVLPFYSRMVQYFPQTERSDEYTKVWPLFRFHRDADANYTFQTITLLPVRFEAFEEVWEPIVGILEYKKTNSGERRLHLLARLYTQRWAEDYTHIHIPLIAEISKEKTGFSYQFLYGLLGIDTRKEKTEFNLLWWIVL